MKNLSLLIAISFVLSGCYSIGTSNNYNSELTWGKSRSKPIYLSFKDTKSTPFYFMLSRDSKKQDYELTVRWKSNSKGDVLFNGYDTTLKFLVDKAKILTFSPVKRPKVVAFNLNSKGAEEEAIFSLSSEEFMKIAYAKDVTVELTGRRNTVMGVFSRRNTIKAFRDFAETSL
ncbi:MAG: hypothetical protein NWP91_04335 [Rickettsiaceae bacterium]|nr:hypothetical protein [Rickettsiaceae bacterium]MDP5020942.1 hypothetical protein [Rickettsiaceae bacterium]MDP5083584.1 hypothetical protein [Rickettsiaceae bacterium]